MDVHLKEGSRQPASVPNVPGSVQQPPGRGLIVQMFQSTTESALIADGDHRLVEAGTHLGARFTTRGRAHELRSIMRRWSP